MSKQLLILISLMFMNVMAWSQDQSITNSKANKTTLGIEFGTGFFQHIKLNLTNFDQEILTTSNNLIPTNLKANFSYYLTPNIVVKFYSGFGFSKQSDRSENDYGQLDSLDVKLIDESIFSMSGFPVETALIFQTAIDSKEKLLLHVGVGVGFYSYTYKAEGFVRELYSESKELKWEEKYNNPEMTLSGWAQFFSLGLNINLTKHIGASFEISKIGLSFVRLKSDVIKQEVYAHQITNELRYGYRSQGYSSSNGLEDVAISLGIFWIL